MTLTLVPPAVEAYAAAHSSAPSALLEELREVTYARLARRAQMQVGHPEGAFLRMLVQLTGARRVVEVGTFTGYSALAMAEGLPDDGELVTCDLDPEATAVARAFFARSPHGRKIQLRLGPALETLRTLQGPLDLAFLDADKQAYGAYFEALLPLLRPGGLLVADNTLWSGRVLAPQADDDHALVAFNTRLAADPRVETVLLTVRDGVTLVRKRA